MPQFVDLLGALDTWVERAEAPPDTLVQRSRDGAASRPLCRWPTYPRYDGAGDPRTVGSFVCTRP